MPTPKTPDGLLQEALDLVEQYGSGHLAVKVGATKLNKDTIDNRASNARLKGMQPTYRKDAPRIYTKKRLGKMHMVIPDTQVKPGVAIDHLEWAGKYAQEKQPDVIVMIGDWWDMPSLSSFDKGKMAFEGRRYVNDIKAGRQAIESFINPISYKPRLVF